MTRPPSNAKEDVRTRQGLLQTLKNYGPQDARRLAEVLGVSAMAVRQHLYDLQRDQLVTFDTEPRPVGRPAKMWRLTPRANEFFPDAHAELSVGLLAALHEAFGDTGVDRLLQIRTRDQIASYSKQVPRRASLKKRLLALAKIRSREGYLADVIEAEEGGFLLVENHCPICTAATACTGLCASELTVFQAVLGSQVEIRRTEHIIAGARRCAYHVQNSQSQRGKS